MIYIAIYIVCFVVNIYIYGSYQINLIVLGFNNEKILGEITKCYKPTFEEGKQSISQKLLLFVILC
jgi:hypothetical protein